MTRRPPRYSKDLSERFPWHRLRQGESFFVPTLDPTEVMREGLVVGRLHYGRSANVRAKYGIVNGLLGVLFTV